MTSSLVMSLSVNQQQQQQQNPSVGQKPVATLEGIKAKDAISFSGNRLELN